MNDCTFLFPVEINGHIEYRCNNWDCLSRHYCPQDIPQGANGTPLCRYLNRNGECPCYRPHGHQ